MRYRTDCAAASVLTLLIACVLATGCTPRERAESGGTAGPADRAALEGATPDQTEPGEESIDDFDAIMVVRAEPKEIAPGETIELLVQVDRRADIGDVRLTLQDLPPGIVLVGEQTLLRPGERVHRIMLQATPLAQGVVDAPVTIVATADGQPDVAHVFHLSVAGPATPSGL